MKKKKYQDVKCFLPLTVQNASINSLTKIRKKKGVKTVNYQSYVSSSQQFYKPISKTLNF